MWKAILSSCLTLFLILISLTLANNSLATGSSEQNQRKCSVSMNNERERIAVQIGEFQFVAILADNQAACEFLKLIQKENLTLQLSDYGGFEKVGSLGQTLTRSDKRITTTSGDIVLYQGNNIVVFYGSNTWSYTKLARIENPTNLPQALGRGGITLTFSLIK